jgi:plasmid stabilization system protein ParE
VSSVVLRADAAAEVEEAYAWYEQQADGLGDEFLSVLEQALASAQAEARLSREPGGEIRRVCLRRFPYEVFYRCLEGQAVVLGCLHASHPHGWSVSRPPAGA